MSEESLSPHWSQFDIATMCGWYHGLNYYHAAVQQQQQQASCFDPPRSKRRKLDSGSHHHHHHSAEITRLRSVTFRPYSDSLHALASSSHYNQFLESNRRYLSEKTVSKTAYSKLKSRDYSLRGEKRSCHSENQELDSGLTTVAHLLPEILTMIFEYLDIQSKGRVARVCWRWREAVYRKSVWKGVEAKLHLNRPNPSTLFSSLVKRGIKNVQVLSLRKSLRELVNGIPNLESLNLSGCYNLTDLALDGAFNKDLPALKTLNLSLCKEVNDNSLGRIATHCKNLENLDLGGCCKITNTGLLLISWGLKKIHHLNLRSCRSISDHGIGHLAGIDSQPSTGSKSLKDLGLQDCQKVTDESLRYISEGLPNLNKMNLSFCVSITDTGMKSLSRLKSLEDLNLRSCDNISDMGIGFLAEDSSPNMRSLDISFCNNITDMSLKHIATGINKLSALSITTCSIQDEGLEKLSKNLLDLEFLNIGQCTKITDAGLNHLSKNSKKLSQLDVYGCSAVTQEAIESIKKLPQIKRVNQSL